RRTRFSWVLIDGMAQPFGSITGVRSRAMPCPEMSTGADVARMLHGVGDLALELFRREDPSATIWIPVSCAGPRLRAANRWQASQTADRRASRPLYDVAR